MVLIPKPMGYCRDPDGTGVVEATDPPELESRRPVTAIPADQRPRMSGGMGPRCLK